MAVRIAKSMGDFIEAASKQVANSADDAVKVMSNGADNIAKAVASGSDDIAKGLTRNVDGVSLNIPKLSTSPVVPKGGEILRETIPTPEVGPTLRNVKYSATGITDKIPGVPDTTPVIPNGELRMGSVRNAEDAARTFMGATPSGAGGVRKIGYSANNVMYVPTKGNISKNYDNLLKTTGATKNEAAEMASAGVASASEAARVKDFRKYYGIPEPKTISPGRWNSEVGEKFIYQGRETLDTSILNGTRVPENPMSNPMAREMKKYVDQKGIPETPIVGMEDTLDKIGIADRKYSVNKKNPKGTGNGKDLKGNPFDNATLKANRYDSELDFAKYSRAQSMDSGFKDIKAGKSNKTLEDLGVTSKTSQAEYEKIRNSTLSELKQSDVNFMDKMGYHKVPQMAVGVGGTAWLVSKLSANKGQQTNAQLYGQRPL